MLAAEAKTLFFLPEGAGHFVATALHLTLTIILLSTFTTRPSTITELWRHPILRSASKACRYTDLLYTEPHLDYLMKTILSQKARQRIIHIHGRFSSRVLMIRISRIGARKYNSSYTNRYRTRYEVCIFLSRRLQQC